MESEQECQHPTTVVRHGVTYCEVCNETLYEPIIEARDAKTGELIDTNEPTARARFNEALDRGDVRRKILVTQQDCESGFWYPRAVDPHWVAREIEMQHHGFDSVEPFRLWDVDANGTPQEAEIKWGISVSNDADYTHTHGDIVNSATGERIASIYTTIDNRS